MTLIDEIATHAANEHINHHCQELDHDAKMTRWYAVFDSVLAALMIHDQCKDVAASERMRVSFN